MDILKLGVHTNGSIEAVVNIWIVLVLIGIVALLAFLFPWIRSLIFRDAYEVDEIELGIGSGKIKLKPNSEDLQIAYKLWVELKTRKLGLPFDDEHDVIVEVYDSWYAFFGITRELIKSVPISKIQDSTSTQLLIRISIDVLNKAIRPHLTRWQAKYRHWHELALKESANASLSPQHLQKSFPDYSNLVDELKKTNSQLVAYSKMLAGLLNLKVNA